MANVIRPIAGTVSSWTSCGFTATDFNNLGSTNFVAVMPTAAAIAQSTNLDSFIEVSFQLTNSATSTTASMYLSLYLFPLNQDGTTYGDGTATGANLPGISYWMTNANPKIGVGAAAFNGSFPRVFIGDLVDNFILGIAAAGGIILNAAAAATVKYRTINTNANG